MFPWLLDREPKKVSVVDWNPRAWYHYAEHWVLIKLRRLCITIKPVFNRDPTCIAFCKGVCLIWVWLYIVQIGTCIETPCIKQPPVRAFCKGVCLTQVWLLVLFPSWCPAEPDPKIRGAPAPASRDSPSHVFLVRHALPRQIIVHIYQSSKEKIFECWPTSSSSYHATQHLTFLLRANKCIHLRRHHCIQTTNYNTWQFTTQ